MSKYKVSAIVAGYNVEEYIEECLDSLSSQTLKELEVIMIDDGSPDKTGEIMDRYSNKYENFKVVHQTNQGLSMVRNNGMDIAEGEFIAFVDGDDIVPENAYALMYSMLAETGSDMVSGGVNRTNGSKVTRSFLHKKAVKDTVRKTNIFNNPELIYDTTSWNKLYRKSLLLENHLSFPKSMLYEDMPLELSCHLLAKSVDIIEDCVYVWRRREGENTSITQQRSDMKNFLDRIKSIEMCFDAIDKYVTDEKKKQRIKRNLEFKVLDLDLMLYINAMNSYDQNYRKEVRTIILNLVNKFDPNIINLLVSSKKLKYSLLMDNELESLAKISNYRAITFRKEKPKKENGKLYQEYKFVTSNSGKPYKIEKTAFTFNNRMESIEVNEENHLIVKGHMYISQLDSKKSSNIKATISILNITNQRDITIPLECKLKSKHVTRKYGVKKSSINPLSRVYNYDYSGYSMKLSLSEAQHILGEGRWKFKINYFYEDIAVEGILGQPQKVKMPNYIFIDETNVLEFKANHDWELYIKSHEPNVLITDIISNDQNEVAFAMKTKETNHKYQIYFEEDETKDVCAKFSLMNKQLVLSKDILEKTNEKIINLYAFDTETYIKYSIYSSIQKKFVNTEEYDLILVISLI
ncbi:glycosyltransferase family 2 protein [Enterococcus sp. OL5]|uniref:glycosyltransferase family 2 protein n=1 Tax=Enterococcus sp. OL5 TaxID=2590214 RepID=UPI001679E604|nr:glycosyltransferase [Enterococcus sp. OL5]